MERKITKVSILTHSNVADHQLIKKGVLELMFDKHHPYNINNVNIMPGSKYVINDLLAIHVYDIGASLIRSPWNPDKNAKIYVNGQDFWQKVGDSLLLSLNEHDIIEISLYDETNDSLSHWIIILNKIFHTA